MMPGMHDDEGDDQLQPGGEDHALLAVGQRPGPEVRCMMYWFSPSSRSSGIQMPRIRAVQGSSGLSAGRTMCIFFSFSASNFSPKRGVLADADRLADRRRVDALEVCGLVQGHEGQRP